jgi:RTX calcium-binding nonapeptide repeat (4 copies)
MLAFACPRWTRMLVGGLAVVVVAAAAAPVLLDDAEAGLDDRDRLAMRLLRLDPGALVGGNTQVASVAGARLVGVPGRVNFMIGLGARQRIAGGDGHDQLGARGAGGHVHGGPGRDLIHGFDGHNRLHGGHGHDLIHGGGGHDMIRGGHGHDLIRGGHGHDRLHGGPGDDRFIDRQGNTVVITGPGTHHVDVSDGNQDRVRCSPGSTNNIVVDRGDRLHRHCRSQASTVRYTQPTTHTAQNKPVSGDGINDDPFIAPCDNEKQVNCTVSSFPGRSLSGLWANEYVPAYKCPASHPYLYSQNYAPFGTALPRGVEVTGLGPIGVSITGKLTVSGGFLNLTSYAAGTRTGGASSSATSWSLDSNSYQVKLHCTSNVDNGYS